MRKMLVITMAVFLSFGFVTGVLAQKVGGEDAIDEFMQKLALANNVSFEGTVLSHDVLCHCFVVMTSTGNLTLQDDYAKFQQEYNQVKGLKIGSMVKGEYKTVDYINYATRVSYK
jgi:hypothetical protein